ncbi:hypothetical protein FW774_15145 [Pedobacter sp. BS3]|uniref:DUF4998 domain-containing protein n=1 Tax=Pedobacter sp. BS3 TaxID=2567937 RepID=UPI0011F072EA|nr:DUF4998 domain-containing protein [Pedobacter sp. BS3]TZF82822.1 hypothetical protein FW774_15145 [Pedobacter sp. BS3]
MRSLIIKIVVWVAFSGAFLSCKKMDSTYRQFTESGKIIYPQRAVKPVIYTGRNRVKIVWLKGTDQSVIRAKIFWNNYTDSLEVPIPPGADTISTIIDNLPEQSYVFNIKTYDAKGNVSVPVELLSATYGEKYQDGLLIRPVNLAEIDEAGKLTIVWGNADISGGAYATEVTYTDNTGKALMKRFPISDSLSTVTGVKKGTTFQYSTLFLPDTLSIDTFYTPAVTENVMMKLDKSGWVASADSYAATSQLANGGGPPQFAIDDNINTFWHTDHTTTKPPYPHWLAADMKKVFHVARVELTSRPNAITADATDYIVQGSMDGSTWTDISSFIMPNTAGPQSFNIPNAPAMRYIRLYMTKGPNYYAHLAEFSVYGYE